ncbi:MAG TPA: hypothetical protein PKH77_05595, partial [Anaerolineae bacterium]|nr:hypothetical protein [Anaerolineae bacterium]
FDQSVAAEAYTLTVATVGQGVVNRDPQGSIILPTSASYAPGMVVMLTAEPAAGWTFSGWSGSLTGNANPAQLTMSADRAVTATFVTEADEFHIYLPLVLRQQ